MVQKKLVVVAADLLRTGLSIKYYVPFLLVCVELEQIRFYPLLPPSQISALVDDEWEDRCY